MAKDVAINKSVRGKPLTQYLNDLPGVQAVVHARAREIEATAEEILQPHHYSDATEVALDRMRTVRGLFGRGWLVSLIDHGAGFEGAIEYGRDDYLVADDDGLRDTTRKIAPHIYKRIQVLRRLGEIYGGMEGLFILTRAVRAVRARHRREFR